MQQSPYVQNLPAILAEMQEDQEGDQKREPGQDNLDYHAYPVTLGNVQGVLYTQEPVPPAYLSSTVMYEEEKPATDQRPLLIAIIFSLVALFILVAVGLLVPYQQPVERETVRVPAILLPLKIFTTSVNIIPTGRKTHPATTAQGLLTITNGSILSEELPQGMIVTSTHGVEIVTDTAVFVPPGSAESLGYATVSAHAVIPGATGNIQTLSINQVEGTALFIRNLQPFTGGRNAFTTTFITERDRANALDSARTLLSAQINAGILLRPCSELITGSHIFHVTWTCQFVTYHLPSHMKVTGVRLVGKTFLIDVIFVARQQRIETK